MIKYDDLVVGEVYYGEVYGIPDYFCYFGKGQWSAGHYELRAKINHQILPIYKKNTDKVVALKHISVFPAGEGNSFSLNEVKKKYRVINIVSPTPVHREF